MAVGRLADWLRHRRVVPAAAVREGLGVSAATLSRLVAGAGPDVVRLGRARATRYALARSVGALPREIPLYRIDRSGEPHLVAHLLTLGGGASCVRARDGADGVYAGLPPVVHDMAPAGYLGRRFAQHHLDLALPPRLQDWTDDHRLTAVARRGEDAPGDVIVGEESLDRALASEPSEVSAGAYPELARRAAEGGAGSSAAGEQPKLTALVDGRHCLVKFTIGDGSPTDVRWRDLLVCEALAARTLASASVPAVEARIVDVGARRFLEVVRFDRIGAGGRTGVLTLGALDDELFGQRDDWARAATRLLREGLLTAADHRRLVLLEAFGLLIGNSDRHFGNVSFRADALASRPALELAPAYDTLPMAWAPNAGGVPELLLDAPPRRASLIDVWTDAVELARDFWTRVAADGRITSPFRAAARSRLES